MLKLVMSVMTLAHLAAFVQAQSVVSASFFHNFENPTITQPSSSSTHDILRYWAQTVPTFAIPLQPNFSIRPIAPRLFSRFSTSLSSRFWGRRHLYTSLLPTTAMHSRMRLPYGQIPLTKYSLQPMLVELSA